MPATPRRVARQGGYISRPRPDASSWSSALTDRQRHILTVLAAGECSGGELARLAQMNRSYTSHIVGGLCWKGLVERVQRGRYVYYRLTDAGRAALQQSAKPA